MPRYLWIERNSGMEVETLRSMADYQVPPQPGADFVAEEGKEYDWERVLAGGTSWQQAPGYRAGGKGSKGGFRARTSLK